MKRLGWTAAVMMCAVVAACGGKVIVDVGGGGGTNTGGAGPGPGPGTGSQGQGGGVTSCMTPPDPGTLMFCGGSVGTGPVQQCATDYCDMTGNVYEALCQTTTCVCTLNGATLCTCALNGPGDICGGTPHCCPFAAAGGF